MTNQELNRDIKRLKKYYNEIVKPEVDSVAYWKGADYIKQEFKRLYYANKELSGLNAESLLTLIRLNVLFRIIPFHQFGINIKL